MNVKIYRCFIASPSDTIEERKICKKVVSELNRTIGNSLNFRIETLTWEDNTRPSVGEYSQGIINEQIGDYEIFIGIMYKKFGTATKNAGSGTEEEFDVAYQKYKNNEQVDIMFYFNDEPTPPSQIDSDQYSMIRNFKKKIGNLGVYYWNYNGILSFEENLRSHLTRCVTKKKHNNISKDVSEAIGKILTNKWEEALTAFSDQPVIWVDPVLSLTNEVSRNPSSKSESEFDLSEIIKNPISTIIKSPPQFGLTSLAHFMIKEAWNNNQLWIYLDSQEFKSKEIEKRTLRARKTLGLVDFQISCILLDSWKTTDVSAFRKLKNLSEAFPDIPIIVMETIEEESFLSQQSCDVKIDRQFNILHLLALPRTKIRKLITAYNKQRRIGEENMVLAKVTSDLEAINIHRTPMNCLTLLKVSERYFDESPINRTKMLEMFLFVLFDLGSSPLYEIRPDLKDCEYVLGRFCENMIRNEIYQFQKKYFLAKLKEYCEERLIDLDIDVVFEILSINNILLEKGDDLYFRSAFWIFFFSAKRMHINEEFAEYIFNSKKYISFPEIIEFYTGIDRNRSDALKKMLEDLEEKIEEVEKKLGMPGNVQLFNTVKWHSTEEQIKKMHSELGDTVKNSNLPDSVKDQYADEKYDQLKPYNQNLQKIFHEYSLYNLMQTIKATARALRNSDYIESKFKIRALSKIQEGMEQVSKAMLAISPILAMRRQATFGGVGFILAGNFNGDLNQKFNKIVSVNPYNVVNFFKNDIFSKKMGPLLFERLENEYNPYTKHLIALLIISERPRNWKKNVENYIVGVRWDSFYLRDIILALKIKYIYDFLTNKEERDYEFLIKKSLAKNYYKEKNPSLNKVLKISNKQLPKRD